MIPMTNLARPEKPFGDPGSPPGSSRPVVASIAVTRCGVGLVYARFDAEHPRDLDDPRAFVVGYELLLPSTDTSDVFVGLVDDRIVEMDLHADVITGHDMLTGLANLSTDVTDLPELYGIRGWGGVWPDREEVNACGDLEHIMVDTAYDLPLSDADLRQMCRRSRLHSWYLDPERDSERLPITTALASTLLAAREMGWCRWSMLDLDPLVTESIRVQPHE
ncbi:hypothetical protein AB0J47_18640 [Nocardia sp. NPDC049737]|uniref:hypothetical protein n=1 Tax=Nocardia sp. NPDC049737 TaxID=3154358 RepID=UPI0034176F77